MFISCRTAILVRDSELKQQGSPLPNIDRAYLSLTAYTISRFLISSSSCTLCCNSSLKWVVNLILHRSKVHFLMYYILKNNCNCMVLFPKKYGMLVSRLKIMTKKNTIDQMHLSFPFASTIITHSSCSQCVHTH